MKEMPSAHKPRGQQPTHQEQQPPSASFFYLTVLPRNMVWVLLIHSSFNHTVLFVNYSYLKIE